MSGPSVLVFVLFVGLTKSAPFSTDFKCAGDSGRTCESGFCYDALIMPEGTQEAGCASLDQCRAVGCFMSGETFLCCCAKNRFCNGKTDSLMWSKYRIFRTNGNSWPTFVPPRIFARNVTTEVPKAKIVDKPPEPKDIRLAPPRRTTEVSPVTQKATTTGSNVQTTTTRTSSTFLPVSTLPTTVTPLPDSTTTEFAVLSSSTATRASMTPKVIKELKPDDRPSTHGLSAIPSSEGERTTRSYSAGTSSSSKRKTTQLPPRIDTVTAVHKSEVNYPQSFPWWYVTIGGFVVSFVICALIYTIVRKYRERRHVPPSARNSVDSSQLSDPQPNERGNTTGDPLLVDKTNRR